MSDHGLKKYNMLCANLNSDSYTESKSSIRLVNAAIHAALDTFYGKDVTI